MTDSETDISWFTNANPKFTVTLLWRLQAPRRNSPLSHPHAGVEARLPTVLARKTGTHSHLQQRHRKLLEPRTWVPTNSLSPGDLATGKGLTPTGGSKGRAQTLPMDTLNLSVYFPRTSSEGGDINPRTVL